MAVAHVKTIKKLLDERGLVHVQGTLRPIPGDLDAEDEIELALVGRSKLSLDRIGDCLKLDGRRQGKDNVINIHREVHHELVVGDLTNVKALILVALCKAERDQERVELHVPLKQCLLGAVERAMEPTHFGDKQWYDVTFGLG